MVPVIVPYRGAGGDDRACERTLTTLELGRQSPGRVARLLQPYVVQVRRGSGRRYSRPVRPRLSAKPSSTCNSWCCGISTCIGRMSAFPGTTRRFVLPKG